MYLLLCVVKSSEVDLADFELGVCSWAERFVSDQDLETAITKVLETFDGVENLCTEQWDGIANFIRSNDVLAVREITSLHDFYGS